MEQRCSERIEVYLYIMHQIYPDEITISGRQPRPSRLQPRLLLLLLLLRLGVQPLFPASRAKRLLCPLAEHPLPQTLNSKNSWRSMNPFTISPKTTATLATAPYKSQVSLALSLSRALSLFSLSLSNIMYVCMSVFVYNNMYVCIISICIDIQLTSATVANGPNGMDSRATASLHDRRRDANDERDSTTRGCCTSFHRKIFSSSRLECRRLHREICSGLYGNQQSGE
jgi:hypothetical protein